LARRLYNTEPAQAIVYPAPRVFARGQATDFTAPAVVKGEITSLTLSQYKGKWVVLFFYPKDFTFVCPTEIIAFSDRAGEFKAIKTEVIAASVDTPEVHLAWLRTPRSAGGLGHLDIPLVSDPTRAIANDYGVLIREAGIALRGLFIIDPEGVVQQITINNLPVGRSVDEVLRLVQGYQYTAKHGEVCPAGWKPGEATMIADPTKSLDYFRAVNADAAPAGEQGKVVTVPNPDELATVLGSDKLTVLFHSASWCGKCRMIAPYIADLSEKYPDVQFVKVETTEPAFSEYITSKSVTSLPEFRFYKSGAEVAARVIGYKKPLIGKTINALKGAVPA